MPKRVALSVAILSAFVAFQSHAATINLTNKGYVTYGDANSYSLPLNGLNVQASYGQIDLATRLGVGSPGHDTNSVAGMDNAFLTPEANNIPGFRMTADNEPGAIQGGWDRNGWWDSQLSALNSALNFSANSMVFFFANNETGEGDNLAAWARVELTRISTSGLLGRFDMTNDADNNGVSGYGPPPVGGGVLMGNVGNYTSDGSAPVVADFLMSGGKVCLAAGVPVDCSGAYDDFVQHNLGSEAAAYAIVVPELDALIKGLVDANADLSDYALHVEYRLGCGAEGAFPQVSKGNNENNTECDPDYAINGGAEKVFLGTQSLTTNLVPEPGAALLVGLGFMGLALSRRRQSK